MTYDITHETRRDVVRLIDSQLEKHRALFTHFFDENHLPGVHRHDGAIDALQTLRHTLIATSAGALDDMKGDR